MAFTKNEQRIKMNTAELTTRPVRDGWYWRRERGGGNVEIIEVFGNTYRDIFGGEFRIRGERDIFFGPLEPPQKIFVDNSF